MTTNAQRPLSVSLLVLPETTAACIYGLFEVLTAVGTAWTALTGEPSEASPMDVQMVGRRPGTFATGAGLPIAPTRALDDVPASDIAIVTDLDLVNVDDPRGRWPEETSWLRRQYESGATVCSVCTGSVCLADAGLLDGGEATTHWAAVPLFARCYPAVRLRPERILCEAGPECRIVTGGGFGAWADLALYLVGRFAGAAEAVRLSKIFVLGDHSDGQLPFAAMNRRRYHEDAIISRCQDWIAGHYASANPVAGMVEYSGLPERTFKRRFRAATGCTPQDYVHLLRVEEARRRLERTDTPADAIAHAVGYEDVSFFRRLFKRKAGMTPSRYRQRFRILQPQQREAGVSRSS